MSGAPADEATRLAAVAHYDILDTPPDDAFDRLAALAARLLDAPFATVSIVDTDRIWFKATHGLHGLTQTAREPGMCASAILRDEPHVVTDAEADPGAARNSLVQGELGIRFYAGVPIKTADGQPLGTINVLDTRPREVSDSDVTNLADLAAVAMDHLDLRLSALTRLREERELHEKLTGFASTLQRTLLPPSLPRVDGLELACHYYAASSAAVTGDFYDVFSLADGRWAFFLGDVAGHGVSAATMTSLIRYTLRTAAVHNSDPAAALDELNTVLLVDPNVRQSCTVMLGILRSVPGGGVDITVAGGGHPPGLWLRPEGGAAPVTEVWPEGGMLVGILPHAKFVTTQLRLEVGQTLLLYTDGLTEARPGREFYGEQRLWEFLAERTDMDAETLVGELTGLVNGFDPPPRDDVALLAMRAAPETSERT